MLGFPDSISLFCQFWLSLPHFLGQPHGSLRFEKLATQVGRFRYYANRGEEALGRNCQPGAVDPNGQGKLIWLSKLEKGNYAKLWVQLQNQGQIAGMMIIPFFVKFRSTSPWESLSTNVSMNVSSVLGLELSALFGMPKHQDSHGWSANHCDSHWVIDKKTTINTYSQYNLIKFIKKPTCTPEPNIWRSHINGL